MYEKIYGDIGKKIANRRRNLGISQEKLAELCDLSRSRISLIECGKCHFNMDTLIILAQNLRVSLGELFGPEDGEK